MSWKPLGSGCGISSIVRCRIPLIALNILTSQDPAAGSLRTGNHPQAKDLNRCITGISMTLGVDRGINWVIKSSQRVWVSDEALLGAC
jgi:hypothetical protein